MKTQPPTRRKAMNIANFKDLPDLPDLEDEAAVQLSDFFYEFASAFENHYSGQIRRYYDHIRSLQREATSRSLQHLKGEKSANFEESVDIQDDELDF
jgi:hypothetical protein